MKYINNNFFVEKVNSKKLQKNLVHQFIVIHYEKLKKNINNFKLNFKN